MKEDEQIGSAGADEFAPARPPFRFWMTGCMAVVMSAFAGNSLARSEARGLVSHSSRYSVAETVLRIEASAQRHGLQMFALVDRSAAANSSGGPDVARWKVVVLASSEGGTLVLMDQPGGQHAVPMSLLVRSNGRGGSVVLVRGASHDQALAGLPVQVKRDLAELPELVAEALR